MDLNTDRVTENPAESRWPAIVALIVAMGMQWLLRNLSPLPQLQYALIALEAALLVFLYVANRGRAIKPKRWCRLPG